MSNNNPVIRIPNLPIGQIVDENGNATDDELSFRHALITSLQNNFDPFWPRRRSISAMLGNGQPMLWVAWLSRL